MFFRFNKAKITATKCVGGYAIVLVPPTKKTVAKTKRAVKIVLILIRVDHCAGNHQHLTADVARKI